MVKGREVLRMLIPDGGYVISGDDYEGITFIEAEPITKKQFTDGFTSYALFKQNKEDATAAAKAALLARLGITADEANLLLG